MKVFGFCTTFFDLFIYFPRDCVCKQILIYKPLQFSSNFNILMFLQSQSLCQTFNTNVKRASYKKVPNLTVFCQKLFCTFAFGQKARLEGLRQQLLVRDRSRTAATSTMEHFLMIVNGWKLLTIITKCFILDVAAVLDPPLASALS